MARDLCVVLGALLLAIGFGLAGARPLRLAGAAVLVAAYAVVTWKTIAQGRQEGGADTPAGLYFDTTRNDAPNNLLIAPLATELPGTLNGVLWIRQGKDARPQLVSAVRRLFGWFVPRRDRRDPGRDLTACRARRRMGIRGPTASPCA
jgi:hypothetical protein